METLRDLAKHLRKFGESPALSWRSGKQRKELTYEKLHQKVIDLSKGFLEYGFQPGDKVCLFCKNIPSWIKISLALSNAGLIDVPRGKYSNSEEINYIIEHSGAKAAIVENKSFWKKVELHQHDRLDHIFSVGKELEGVTAIDEIEELGKESKLDLPSINPDDTAGIIYTSGTTGVPKGVILSHKNFMSNLKAVLSRVTLTSDDKFLSVLPAWHVFERIVKYCALATGAETFYSSPQKLIVDLEEESPTFMASVPRIWELVYDRIMRKIRKKGKVKKRMVRSLLKAAISFSIEQRKFSPLKLLKALAYKWMDKKIFSELRERLGGRLRFAISGGGALRPEIDKFFNAGGVEILEGYGLTETSPVVAVRPPGEGDLHTVGPILENMEAKIIDYETGEELGPGEEGVLYVKGPNVMKGYYRSYEKTKKVLDNEGWFDTGDIGYFDDNGNLVITGRQKHVIVLSNGKNVNPLSLENELSKSPFISTVIVTGQDWKKLGALIVPEFEMLESYCEKNDIQYSKEDVREILDTPEVQQLFREKINKYISIDKGFKPYELIRDFVLLTEDFTVGEELTPTLKPKRAKIEKIYKEKIHSMQAVINK